MEVIKMTELRSEAINLLENVPEEKISPLAAGILQGLNEAIEDAQGFEVEGMKKTTIYRKQKIVMSDVVKYSEEKISAYRKAANK